MPANLKRIGLLTRGLAIFGTGAFILHAWRLGLTLLGTSKRYHIARDRMPAVDSEEFRLYLSTITGAPLHACTKISVLRNGDEFYKAELDAIRAAAHSINIEAYEFLEGEVTRQFMSALEERAWAGVQVRLVVDAVGSWGTKSRYFDPLRRAGGQFAWYHPVNSNTWPYLNNRTHRKLVIVDGKTGFIGGAGFADHWVEANAQGPPWRDTVLRVEGRVVGALNAVFGENWLDTTGEILAGPDQFRFENRVAGVASIVVSSTPRSGGTRARVLYQTLVEAAQHSIDITTPYFVPDRSARKAIVNAVRRGVDVRILTAGAHSDHALTRRISRMYAAHLAKEGARIYEYQPSMIHAKLMTVDGLWTVAGSTNFDHRSFDLNDEVNIATSDASIAARIREDFSRDLDQSRLLDPKHLGDPDIPHRLEQGLSWVIRREQ